jgi:membrane associated rhomboid family serine protease
VARPKRLPATMAYRTYRTGFEFGFGYGLTPVVKKLIIANVAVFVASFLGQAAGLGSLFRVLMLTPSAVIHGALWQLVTYMFLHAGFWHILFNMFGLWMFGGELERTWGSRRFLQYYFLTGIGAGVTVVLLSWASSIPTVGASGAVYGILLAYGVLFPNRIILVPIFFFFFIPVPAKYLVMILGGIAFLSALSGPGDMISHTGHLGGMVFGLAYLRGRPYWFELRNGYYRWRRQRLQRQFQVYMRKHGGRQEFPESSERDEPRRGPWVN